MKVLNFLIVAISLYALFQDWHLFIYIIFLEYVILIGMIVVEVKSECKNIKNKSFRSTISVIAGVLYRTIKEMKRGDIKYPLMGIVIISFVLLWQYISHMF